MKLLVAALVLALALPALATSVSDPGAVVDGNGRLLPYVLGIESASGDTCHYNATNDATPDTVDWAKFGVVLGPTATPVSLYVEWVTEANVTFGYVQFKERAAGSTASYTWGDVARFNLAILANADTHLDHYFRVGLWDSARAWAAGSSDGRMAINMLAEVLE